MVPVTVWLRRGCYDRLVEGAQEYGTLLEVFVALHLEECCR
jgi:hypothetical protein